MIISSVKYTTKTAKCQAVISVNYKFSEWAKNRRDLRMRVMGLSYPANDLNYEPNTKGAE